MPLRILLHGAILLHALRKKYRDSTCCATPEVSHWLPPHSIVDVSPALEFIPLSFWYDAPLTSQDCDRRHDPWLVGAALGRTAMQANSLLGSEWTSYPHPPKARATIGSGGHENTLGGDTGEWCGRGTRPRRQRRGS